MSTTPETPTPETDTEEDKHGNGNAMHAHCHDSSHLSGDFADFARRLERERDAARAEVEAMRAAIREALAMLLEIEYQGNDKGTRCIICGKHCCDPHEVDCAMRQAIQKTKPFITNATPPKP